jgi:hypothetical protein
MSKINVEEILQKHSLKLGCYLESYGIDHQLQEMLKAAIKEIVEQVVDRINSKIEFVKTTSEELNSKDYQPFITDEDGQLWTINKDSILKVKEEIVYE